MQGKPLDPRTDIFSFGCVLYEAITGRRAFQGTTSFETLKRILTDEPEPIIEPLPHVQLQPVVKRCLAKNPDDRYQSMQELSHELRGVLRRLEAATHRETRDRIPWPRLLAGAAGIIALVVAIWWMTESGFLGRAPANVGIQRLTLSGTAIDAATSRDGRISRGSNRSAACRDCVCDNSARIAASSSFHRRLLGTGGLRSRPMHRECSTRPRARRNQPGGSMS